MVAPDVRMLFEAQMNEAGVDCRMAPLRRGRTRVHRSHRGQLQLAGLRYDRDADERSWRAMLNLFGESVDKPGRH